MNKVNEREMLHRIMQFLEMPPCTGTCIMVNERAWNRMLKQVEQVLFEEKGEDNAG